jgi:hypothetical protein
VAFPISKISAPTASPRMNANIFQLTRAMVANLIGAFVTTITIPTAKVYADFPANELGISEPERPYRKTATAT